MYLTLLPIRFGLIFHHVFHYTEWRQPCSLYWKIVLVIIMNVINQKVIVSSQSAAPFSLSSSHRHNYHYHHLPHLHHYRPHHTYHHDMVLISFVLSCLFLQGGMYFFQIMDWYTAVISLFFVAMGEAVAVCWVYGKHVILPQYR